jgi:hypothetical protein
MSANDKVFEILVNLENELQKFEVRSTASKISKLLGPNYYEFVASGKILAREDALNRLPHEDDKVKIESSNFKMTELSSDAILLTYVSKKINPDKSSLQYLRSSLWKKNSGSWQLEFHQGTIKN